MGTKIVLGTLFCALIMISACELELTNKEQDADENAAVTVTLALSGSSHDVGGFLYEIFCDNGNEYEAYAGVSPGRIPDWLLPDDAGDEHYFADLFMMLPAGSCTVEAMPMQNPDTPSQECFPVAGAFEVLAGEPTEIVLMAQCKGATNGSVDIVTGLNDPPFIETFQYDPSKFIDECQTLYLYAEATDPNGDIFDYNWSVIEAPPGAVYELDFIGGAAEFFSKTSGQYLLRLEVTDVYQATGTFEFIVHVLNDPFSDGCPPPVVACCNRGLGYWRMMPPNECQAEGGIVDEDDTMCKQVCCAVPLHGLIVEHGTCLEAFEGQVNPTEECNMYCCLSRIGGPSYVHTIGTECPADIRIDEKYCEEGPICCYQTGGVTGWLDSEEGCLQALHPDSCKEQ